MTETNQDNSSPDYEGKDETSWHKGWRGRTKHVPCSERQGRAMAQTVLFPIQAQIAIYFGSAAGDLNSLREGMTKFLKKEPVICEACGQDIYAKGHKNDCYIVAQFTDVTTKEPCAEKVR